MKSVVDIDCFIAVFKFSVFSSNSDDEQKSVGNIEYYNSAKKLQF